MSQPFPSNPYLTGNFAPILMECDAPDLPITGALPQALRGTLYRIGPNPMFAPRDDFYHWFIGDGMVHAFEIEHGRVRYRNRWVQTEKLRREQAAGRALFGSWGNPATTDPSVQEVDGEGVANTNVLWHGDKLLALEEAHPPIALDPRELTTLGAQRYQADLGGNALRKMTAHPKIDPVTGEMVFFAYSAEGPFTPAMLYGVLDRAGRLTQLEQFAAPYPSMVHDFMVTRNYALFPILPLSGSMERAMRGEPAYAWEPEKGSHIGIMPRAGGSARMRWFRNDACYMFHVMNAWEEGSKIIADVMQYDSSPIFSPGTSQDGASARLCRWTFDLEGDSDTFTRTWLDDLPGEFPRFDERFAMQPYRHGYFAWRGHESTARSIFDGLAHLDTATGKRKTYLLPEGDGLSEPVFVPRADNAAEGDGWLLATIYRGAEHRSDLAVFDASEIERGPVALAHLSHRVPFGFHGNWRSHG